MDKNQLSEKIQQRFAQQIKNIEIKDIVTVNVKVDGLLSICEALRDEEPFKFEELMDLCGVDYFDYGVSQWRTEETTTSGFSRGAAKKESQVREISHDEERFAVVYHLLSITHNHRLRLKVYLKGEPLIPSVLNIWNSANWYEREAFDLYGIVFDGHPDLRRLLTDYGFVGHPFRKDFPLIGEVELRYDAALKRCIYEPVSIQPRVLVPKVIRKDTRYIHTKNEEGSPNAS